MLISVRHAIRVTVGEGLARAHQHLLLTPQVSSVQTVEDWRIEAPGMDDAMGFVDAFGNRAHLASQTRPEAELTIEVTGRVATHDRNGIVGRLPRDPVPALFRRVTPLTRPIGAITSRFRSARREDRIALLHELNAVTADVVGAARQSQSQSREARNGQSQSQSQAQSQSQSEGREGVPATDYAHAFIGAARELGIPARFVTGYLVPDDEDAHGAFHAWVEAWDDGLGWIGFDPVLGQCPAERHVRIAVGLDADSAAPVRAAPALAAPEHRAVWLTAEQ